MTSLSRILLSPATKLYQTTTPVSRQIVIHFIGFSAVLIGAMLTAVHIRLRLMVGNTLGEGYIAQPPLLYAILFLCAAGGSVLYSQLYHPDRIKNAQFYSVLASAVASAVLMALLLPDVSILQLVYFALAALLISLVTIRWTPLVAVNGEYRSLFYHLRQLWKHRVLLRIWTRYNILSRYSQTFLGILWIVLLPLSNAFLLAFVFSQIIRLYEIGDVPFISFFLVALTFWTVFQQGILIGTSSIIARMGLVTQIYFPREIIVIVRLCETLVDFTFTFGTLLVINLFVGILPNVNYLYLIPIFAIQILFVFGLMLFVSYLSVFIRDIPQLISVLVQFLFYLTPIIYPRTQIPDRFQWLSLINPLVPLIDSYRSIMLYNIPPDPVDLYYPLVVSCVLVYTGFLHFKAREKRLADFV